MINLVDEALGEQMNQCAVDFPPEVSEIDAAKLHLLPSEKIKIPRIAEAPAALECRHFTTLEVSAQRRLAIGEILHVHVRDGLWDPDKMRVDMTRYRPLARLFGNFYASLGEPFTHVRQSYEEWARSGRANHLQPRAAAKAGIRQIHRAVTACGHGSRSRARRGRQRGVSAKAAPPRSPS